MVGCRPVVSVLRHVLAQTWVWRKPPRTAPLADSLLQPLRPGWGSGMCWAEGLVASLSLCLSGQLRRARPHLHLIVLAPEARKEGGHCLAWSQNRCGHDHQVGPGLGADPSESPSIRRRPVTSVEGLFFLSLGVPKRTALRPRCRHPSLLGACPLRKKHQFTKTLALAVSMEEGARHGLTSLSCWPEPASSIRRCVAGPRRCPLCPVRGPPQPSS